MPGDAWETGQTKPEEKGQKDRCRQHVAKRMSIVSNIVDKIEQNQKKNQKANAAPDWVEKTEECNSGIFS